jgi:hypothetical protein
MGVTSNGFLPIGKISGVCLEPNRYTLFCWIRIRIDMRGRIQIRMRIEENLIPPPPPTLARSLSHEQRAPLPRTLLTKITEETR